MVQPNKFLFTSMVFCLFCSLPASANPDVHTAITEFTGNEFYARCNSTNNLHKSWCLGYITGISDGVAFLQMGKPDRWTPICIPIGVTIGQQKDVVLDYISRNPATRHEAISLQTILAWRDAWPCWEKN